MATKEKVERETFCRFLRGAVTSKNNFVEMILPVGFVRFREGSKLREEGMVKMFDLSISLGVVRRGARISDVRKLFQLIQESIFEFSTLIVVNLGRKSKAGDEIVVTFFSGSFC